MNTLRKIPMDTPLSPSTKYLNHEILYQHKNNENITKKALERARELCEAAQLEYEEEMEKAYREGRKRAEDELMSSLFESSLKSQKLIASIEKEIIDIVELSLRQILGDVDMQDIVQATVPKLLERVKQDAKVTLMVSEESFHTVKKQLEKTVNLHADINLVIDPEAEDPHHFIMKTKIGTINGSLDNKIESIISQLKRQQWS